MHEFTKLAAATGYAFRTTRPSFVFEGPDGGYVVAGGREAAELMSSGLEPVAPRSMSARSMSRLARELDR